MAIDNRFLIQKLQKVPQMYVAFCTATNMPLVVCDPDTYNDQVWVFSKQEILQEFAKPYLEKKIPVRGVIVDRKQYSAFFGSLHVIGANEVVFQEDTDVRFTITLTDLAPMPDYSKLPVTKRPLFNPELQLTGLYFMQEFSRPVPNEEKENLPALDEEFSVNIARARYLVPIEFNEGEGTATQKLARHEYKLPILRGKNGEILQPIFSDAAEFQKFARGKQISAITLPFVSLRPLLVKDSKGFILNPAGYHILLPGSLLETLQKKFPDEVAKGVEQARAEGKEAARIMHGDRAQAIKKNGGAAGAAGAAAAEADADADAKDAPKDGGDQA